MELRIPPSRLERRVRLLLRAYPPGYRAGRGEEMLDTLLEATPEGRDWPSARDSWSLLAGGVRARRTANRQAGPAASLRQAVVLGLALYVSMQSAEFFMGDPLTRWHGTLMLAGFLLAATALAAWAGRRTVTVVAVPASFAVLAYFWYQAVILSHHHRLFQWMANMLISVVSLLLVMLALVVLARRDGPPPRSWLILVGAPPLAVLVARMLPVILPPDLVSDLRWNLLPEVFLLLAIPALAWLATDARPALGVALAHVVSQAVTQASFMQIDIARHVPVVEIWQSYSGGLEILAVTAAMTVALAWMLRRRTRPHPR